MSRKVISTLVIILMLSILLIPPIIRTYPYATEADGLIVIAGLCERDLSLNPFSTNGYIVRPEMAMWLLMNTEFPYKYERLKFSQPLVYLVGASFGFTCINDNGNGYDLLEHLIEHGEPVNEYHHGLAPIHAAILFNDPIYLEILLNSGANPNLKIDREGKKHHNMNAFQFLEFICFFEFMKAW